MAPYRSPPRPRSTNGSPRPRGRAWRTCSAPRARRNCSADEPIPDPPHAPAAPHSGVTPLGAGDAPRPLAARVAPVRVPRGGHPAGSRRLARCPSDFGGRAREGCRAGATARARAGIDIVAPRDMRAGGGGGMRKAPAAAGFSRVPILSSAAKMASAFYGPFREAAGSAPQSGDRQSYQMQGTNADEAMREIRLDVEEGADIVLVKPALPCLDLIRRAEQEFGSPLAAYQVSGEYAMIKAAAARGMLDEARAMWETLYAIRRAGADIILSYFAPTVADAL